MAQIIAFSGTHGTGKTTAVLKCAYALKKKYPDKRIEYFSESASYCPFDVNKSMTEDSQFWIFGQQIQAELKLMTLFDIIVSDRTIVDAIAYTYAIGLNGQARALMGVARYYIRRYSRIYFMTMNKNDHHHDDGLRDQDPAFRAKVEDLMLRIYKQLGCPLVMR